MNLFLVASSLIVLHNVDGNPIFVNPSFITILHPTSESRGKSNNTLVTGGVNCVVSMSNGKFFSVVEPCDEVRKMIDGVPGQR